MTILECEDCSHKFLSKDVELTNVEITNEFFNIRWNCPKCNAEGLELFINNKKGNNNSFNNDKK
jgi:hypothetical protein